jgi:hypothetical protein
MRTAYNVFEPRDLEIAQAIFDDAWASLPGDVRSGSRGDELKEWVARQVLTAIKQNDVPTSAPIKSRLMETDLSAWS